MIHSLKIIWIGSRSTKGSAGNATVKIQTANSTENETNHTNHFPPAGAGGNPRNNVLGYRNRILFHHIQNTFLMASDVQNEIKISPEEIEQWLQIGNKWEPIHLKSSSEKKITCIGKLSNTLPHNILAFCFITRRWKVSGAGLNNSNLNGLVQSPASLTSSFSPLISTETGWP